MYGAPTELEGGLAEVVTGHVDSVETLRLVNSGTAATVGALGRSGDTGRDKIVVMQGGYHGGHESFIADVHFWAPIQY